MAPEQTSESHSDSDHASPVKRKKTSMSASSAKDPTRPRRKKARRACLACQRAHLTCGDERPCNRCLARGLGHNCIDGIRKKAKYLHDAPDGALVPGVNGHYPTMPPPSQGHGAVPVPHQQAYYTPTPTTTYYPPNPNSGPPAIPQENSYGAVSAPISPSYNQNQASGVGAPPIVSQPSRPPMHQFGSLAFDPSDPAFFNFDLSSLNFGNHYGALELGMLGHMSSGAMETPGNENPLNQPTGVYNQPIPPTSYGERQGVMPFEGSPAEWQTGPPQHGSMQVQTPSTTPVTSTLDHGSLRHDSLNGPHAYAIAQGPSSLASASPASTDVHSGHDANDNPMAAANYFASMNQQRARNSPIHSLQQQGNRAVAGPVQPVQSMQAARRQALQSEFNYDRVTQPYNYVGAYHRLIQILEKRFSPASIRRAKQALGIFRPVLLSNMSDLSNHDLIHAEKSLQRSLVALHSSFTEVGTPCLICRRTGEVVGMNKEFEILTGWKQDVLLGRAPNLNVNLGPRADRSNDENSTGRTNTTPLMSGQEPDQSPHAVNIIELMDEPSAMQYLDDFSDLAYEDPFGKGHRRVNMLRYLTKEDMVRLIEHQSGEAKNIKNEVKSEHSTHHGEGALRRNLGATGVIDAMIMWHIKRDNFDMPMLVSMQIMPMLKP
ncbi:hypothetical protein DM02DRAFT_575535 [Periconia macrospinosa]|uniref:Zn(2)-C6 fungal-type domain-containing protein n=1 Tax=Periconia macrospinosa TaxID=97972 RepID=A0A2V1D5X5_9PLEO|nr:hypothetical protein DM02DRAFT_575535 [Periconia macrospinosa]